MILYVDETENRDYFIVTGLLFKSREEANRIYKNFKKKARNLSISAKEKSILFTEFKSVLMDRRYQKLKIKMIESISEADYQIIYSCYMKKNETFPQTLKEDAYIALLSRIVLNIEEEISVIFDTFNKKDFEKRIIDGISPYSNVKDIMSCDSQREEGLQLVDNMCSIMRLHLSGMDDYGFYELIKGWVRQV